MKPILAVIPARLGSTRLKNKMLLPIDDMPVICHTVYRVQQVPEVGRIVVVTDSEEIADEIHSRFAEVDAVIDPEPRGCGLERTAHLVSEHPQLLRGHELRTILHVHGDEALIEPDALRLLIDRHHNTGFVRAMTQLVYPITEEDAKSNSACKIVLDGFSIAAYSRHAMSYYFCAGAFTLSVGALLSYTVNRRSRNETATDIEQFRLLDNSFMVRHVCFGRGHRSAIDVEADYQKACS